jgi:hypothetical protein
MTSNRGGGSFWEKALNKFKDDKNTLNSPRNKVDKNKNEVTKVEDKWSKLSDEEINKEYLIYLVILNLKIRKEWELRKKILGNLKISLDL